MESFDILILGGGPAGMTAGLYAARAGLRTALFEGELVGGQASTTDTLENYPGYPAGIGGPELMMMFADQAQRVGLDIRYEGVTGIDIAKKTITTRKGEYEARALILAMGAKRRMLGVPGEAALIGRGVSYCATCDGAIYRGKSVAIVGGGATAVEDALYLAVNSQVTLIHRRDELRAEAALSKRLMENPNVTVLWDTVVTAIEKTEVGIRLLLKQVKTDQSSTLDCAGCFIAVGTEPQGALIAGQIEIDKAGYIVAGEDTHTSAEGVYVAGDLRDKPLRQVITAASDGAVAATEAAKYLLAE